MSGDREGDGSATALTDEIRQALVERDPEGNDRLVGGRCGPCGRHQFPLTTCCPYCGASAAGAIERVLLADHGELWGWTAVRTAPPGYRGRVPFGFGVVELPEGIRVVTRLSIADPDRLSFGLPMKLVAQVLHTDADDQDRFIWCFTPAVGV